MARSNDIQYAEIYDEYTKDMDSLSKTFISGKNLYKDYELKDYIIRAVDNLSIDIKKHEYIALIGHSGAGKTTLLHILSGLEPVSEGDMYLSHVNVSNMGEEPRTIFRIFNVGLVFQNYNLISSLTAVENIMFPLQLSGVDVDTAEKKAIELLDMIGLKERKTHLPFQLSAGEQQRVAIARALANDPPIIIADEPTANLDKDNATFIAEMFEKMRKEGRTIIVATHDEKLISYAHRIITMADGAIVKDESLKEIDFKEDDVDVVEKADA